MCNRTVLNYNETSTLSSSRSNVWWFGQIFPVVVIVFGVIGNTLIICILRKKQYAQTSTCYYMQALAWSDNFVMMLLFVRWLSKIPNTPMERDTYFCVLYFFFVRFGFGISAWNLMAMTFDRYISVRFPLKAKSICTIFRGRITLFVIAIIHIVSHLPYFWRYSNPNGRTLSEKCPYNLPHSFAVAYQILRMVVFDRLLPWIITLGFTIAMTVELNSGMDKRLLQDFKVTRDRKLSRRVTVMSLSVSWMFFMLTFPTTIYESIRVLYKLRMPKFLYELFVYFLYLNSAINFYLYITVAKQFRIHFIRVLYRLVGKKPPRRKLGQTFSNSRSFTSTKSRSSSRVTIDSVSVDMSASNSVSPSTSASPSSHLLLNMN